MTRFAALLGVAALAGCQQADPRAATPDPPAPPPAAAPTGEIDFAGWPAATATPHFVTDVQYVLCASMGFEQSEFRRKQYADSKKRHGPHDRRSVVVRTNPAALAAFKAGTAPMPVGTTVVKEKWPEFKADAGYDPEHGDWEYVFVTLRPTHTVMRGKLAACANCHAVARDRDSLFRSYLAPK